MPFNQKEKNFSLSILASNPWTESSQKVSLNISYRNIQNNVQIAVNKHENINFLVD
jgi:hypothetical protein